MKVMIAGHDIQVRRALRLLLEYEREMEVVGEVYSADQITEKARLLLPDLVLLDWDLAGLDREDILLKLESIEPRPYVAALSGHPEYRREALELGVEGFVSRWEPPQEVLNMIRKVHAKLKDKCRKPS